MVSLKVIGIVSGTYTCRKTGDVKPFTRIYCSYPLSENISSRSSFDFDGYGTEVIFIPRHCEDISCGNFVRPIYNKYGTCVDIQVF